MLGTPDYADGASRRALSTLDYSSKKIPKEELSVFSGGAKRRVRPQRSWFS
jgi:hypothetical protein